jgi:acyl-CoA synthetase (NDP forming)
MAASLERLFRPRHIAVFGGREAAQVVLQSDRLGFPGEIWPVHPSRDEVHGRRCFRSVAELPEPPDAAFVGVNRSLTIEIVGALSERGAGGAICYASGFREAGDGEALQDSLVRAAGDMPIVGPNCYGLINYLDGALLWPDQHGGARVERGVAIVTQSSNMAINMTMQRRGLPIAYLATAGNQAQIGLADIADGLLSDTRVTAIGLHVEGIGDASRFEAMAFRAREFGKPVVVLKVGRSEQSQAATITHTASLAGSEAATAAFFSRLGIARVRSIPEFLETLKLLHVHGPLPGGDLASLSCSGGEASLMADAATGRSVRYRSLDADEMMRVKATLNTMVTVANPLDYHTFAWAKEAVMTETFSAMIGCGFDLSMLVLDFPRDDRCNDTDWDIAVRAISQAARRTGARVAVVATLPENMPEARAAAFLAAEIAPLAGVEEAHAAAEAAACIGRRWKEPLPQKLLVTSPCRHDSVPLPHGERSAAKQPGEGDIDSSARRAPPHPALSPAGRGRQRLLETGGASARTLFEAEAKRLIAEYGVPVPAGRIASTPAEAVTAAEDLGYPVALKALGVAHKSDAGAVQLHLSDAAAVENAANRIAGLGAGLLVETMITDAVAELLVGVTRDEQFGLLLTIGAGGVLVELLGESTSLLLPAGEDEIRSAIVALKIAPLLQGFRGRPVADLNGAVAAIVAIARFAEAQVERLEELDVNPLLLRPEGWGAVAADALIRMREE